MVWGDTGQEAIAVFEGQGGQAKWEMSHINTQGRVNES